MISRRAFSLISGAAALAPTSLWAQDKMDGSALNHSANLYLPQYLELIEKSEAGDQAAQSFLYQFASFVGDEARATSAPQRQFTVPEELVLTSEPAIKTIVERARDKRVVILNEHHCISRHRSFTLEVLRALRLLGFDIFAAETFIGKPRQHHPVHVEDLRHKMPFLPFYGYYSRDPVYAETVREALELGYRLAAYEQAEHQSLLSENASSVDQINEREEAQARNLIDNILTPNPDSKVVVLCGHSHILEEPQGEREWFASRLKRYSGIDPLTVEQSLNWPAFDPANDPSLTRTVLERLAPDHPVCVFEPSGQAFTFETYSGKVDLSVFHPRKPAVNNRPEWWANDPKRRAAPVRFTPSSDICLIQAIRSVEGMGAVPSDHVLVPAGDTSATLYLRSGYYVIRRETQNGWDIIGELEVTE